MISSEQLHERKLSKKAGCDSRFFIQIILDKRMHQFSLFTLIFYACD